MRIGGAASRQEAGNGKGIERQAGVGGVEILTKRDQAGEEAGNAEVDTADVTCAKRVLDDPGTEWVDWDDAKRELAH